MLKKEEMKQLSYATTLLAIVREYALDENTTDFYDKTGITILDLDKSIKNLTHIHSIQAVKHLQASNYSTEYKRQHKTHRNIMQNINNARHRNDQKKLDYWTQKLEESKRRVM